MAHGRSSPTVLGHDEGHSFEQCNLDKSWYGVNALVRAIPDQNGVQSRSSFLTYQHRSIKHREIDAGYWQAHHVVWTLANLFGSALFHGVGLDFPKRTKGKPFTYRFRGKEEKCWASLPTPDVFAAFLAEFDVALRAHSSAVELPDCKAPTAYYAEYLIETLGFLYKAVRPALTREDRPLWTIVRVSS